jgi:adenine-specific DNA-methyltransferase
MQLNAEDGGNRKFIMVQLPEITDEKSEAHKAGYKNICEIGKERIRRAGAKIKDENPLITENLDTGFRVLKLDTSNLIAWDGAPITASDPNERVQILWDRFTTRDKTIKRDRSDLDIVFEIMLKMGVHLDYVVSEIMVGERKCYSIGEKTFENNSDCMILVCLDFGITPEDIAAMCGLAPKKIIAAEEAFEDSTAMSNAYYILKNKDIEMKLL